MSDLPNDLSHLFADIDEVSDSEDASEMYSDYSTPTDAPEEVRPNVSKETAPRRITSIGKRHSTETLFTGLYGLAGTALVHTGTDIPVGRVLQFQAPVAGGRIDEIIAGTWIDKMIQPLVQYQDKAAGLGSLLLLPILVGAYERAPQLATLPMFEQIIRATIENSLMEMAPMLKKQAAAKKKAAKDVADIQGLGADLGLDGEAMKDPVGAILGGFFYIPEQEQPAPTPESE